MLAAPPDGGLVLDGNDCMGVIGGTLGYELLKAISKGAPPTAMDGSAYATKSKVETLLGRGLWNEIAGKVVIDFGCGTGAESIEMAKRGARKVIGVDIQERFLAVARERAAAAGLGDRCEFVTSPSEQADVIVSIDAFEHFAEPAAILRAMRAMLKPTGCVVASFGPTWYHPLGGHLFSVFPWAHLIFTEKALIRWRSTFKTDGATRFDEVEGGLNQMTIRRFEKIVAESSFRLASLETIPIRRLESVHNRMTREFTTAVVRCKLQM
jgi:ubiquinone/menaquinone biosynthesis C-methylase UbiE